MIFTSKDWTRFPEPSRAEPEVEGRPRADRRPGSSILQEAESSRYICTSENTFPALSLLVLPKTSANVVLMSEAYYLPGFLENILHLIVVGLICGDSLGKQFQNPAA